jgi:hypothetical protein
VAATDNGRTVYAGSITQPVVAVFDRSRDGGIHQLAETAGCVAERSYARTRGLRCGPARRLTDIEELVASPDSRSLYATSTTLEGMVIFRADARGRLRQPAGRQGCISWSGDGCAAGRGLYEGGDEAVVSPDSRNVYVGTPDGWAAFHRVRRGPVEQLRGRLGCGIDEEWIVGDDEGCQHHAVPFVGYEGVASADGRHVYFGGSDSLFAFRRLR